MTHIDPWANAVRPPRGKKKIDAELKAAKKLVRVIEKQQSEILAKTRIQCTGNNYGQGCGEFSPIGKLTYIQTQWYTRPYSCMSGDYWNNGEGQWICPHCDHRNRLAWNKDIEALKSHFKNIIVVKDD